MAALLDRGVGVNGENQVRFAFCFEAHLLLATEWMDSIDFRGSKWPLGRRGAAGGSRSERSPEEQSELFSRA